MNSFDFNSSSDMKRVYFTQAGQPELFLNYTCLKIAHTYTDKKNRDLLKYLKT